MIIGSKVTSKFTGKTGTIEKIDRKNRKISVSFENGGTIDILPDSLTMDQALADEIYNEFHPKKTITYTTNSGSLTGKIGSYRVAEVDPSNISKLVRGVSYGNTAKDIYEKLCDNPNFGWDKSVSGSFGMQQELIKSDCTPSKRWVWFLANSSYNQMKAKKEVINIIEDNDDSITIEINNSDIQPIETVGIEKVVFVKNMHGQYEFWGKMKTDLVTANKVHDILLSDEYIEQ